MLDACNTPNRAPLFPALICVVSFLLSVDPAQAKALEWSRTQSLPECALTQICPSRPTGALACNPSGHCIPFPPGWQHVRKDGHFLPPQFTLANGEALPPIVAPLPPAFVLTLGAFILLPLFRTAWRRST